VSLLSPYLLVGVLLACGTALPLAWKWELGLGRVALFVLAAGGLAALVVAAFGTLVALPGIAAAVLVWALAMACAASVLAYRFFRDPERDAPTERGVIVSPADGQVIYVRHARRGVLPAVRKHGREYTLEELTRTQLWYADAVVVGIAMNFLDVHVNRAPIAGTVTLRRHLAGGFGSLKKPETVFQNERTTTVLERGDLQIAVVQIASRLVRQIVSFIDEGQQVALGQRIGVIRFGSQVDLVLPARHDLQITVRPGTRVRAGTSTVATTSGASSGTGVAERSAHPGHSPDQ
jgi:phosphatidylserine decarboxylase